AAKPLPFVLGAGNELIDDRLGCVPEIAVLRLPQNETVGIIEAVTIFEAKHAGLGQGAIINLHRRLIGGQVLKRGIGMAILEIVQHGMTLAERAAFGVLS